MADKPKGAGSFADILTEAGVVDSADVDRINAEAIEQERLDGIRERAEKRHQEVKHFLSKPKKSGGRRNVKK